MASLESSLDMAKVFANQVVLNVEMKNANAVLRRLVMLTWILKLLAWIGGVKEVTFTNLTEEDPAPGWFDFWDNEVDSIYDDL